MDWIKIFKIFGIVSVIISFIAALLGIRKDFRKLLYKIKDTRFVFLLRSIHFNGIKEHQQKQKKILLDQIISDIEFIRKGFCGPIIKPYNKKEYRNAILGMFQDIGMSLLQEYDELYITWNITERTIQDFIEKSFEKWLYTVKEFSSKKHATPIHVKRYVFIDEQILNDNNIRGKYIDLLENIRTKDYFPFSQDYFYDTFFFFSNSINDPKIKMDYALFKSKYQKKKPSICQYSEEIEGVLYIYFIKNKDRIKRYENYFNELAKKRNKISNWDDLFDYIYKYYEHEHYE